QALSLLNNSFNLTMSQEFAKRVQAESERPVERAFTLVTGRAPLAAEQKQLKEYAEEHGMANLCRVLFNVSEFIFLD
ncbi:MAG: DUF1553 domain-containing protein, partial [Fuerstiella sp.]|nr:DUF1553 domain-containing protein [Fuerstiella sp.]